MAKSKSVDDVADKAWNLVSEALETGKIRLGDEVRDVDTQDLINLAVKMAATKIKQPRLINKPEDFVLPVTTGEDDES